jgi:intracellular sulfur oxidation DsrE/DsrF family protein
MLKITVEEGLPDSSLLRLEGSLAGPWVAELRRLCKQALTSRTRVVLHCADVSFIDDKGVLLAQSLTKQGVSFANCSPYVAERLGLKL